MHTLYSTKLPNFQKNEFSTAHEIHSQDLGGGVKSTLKLGLAHSDSQP